MAKMCRPKRHGLIIADTTARLAVAFALYFNAIRMHILKSFDRRVSSSRRQLLSLPACDSFRQ
jgi:hypothetical protein